MTTISFAQDPWNLVWRMTAPPYLTLEQISEMGMVKAGFDTDKDGWGEFICAWTDLDTNAILMYEATGNDTYELVWSWVYPIAANSFAGFAVGDINNNGVVEIITTMPAVVGADPNPPRLWVFEWNGVAGENKYGVFNSGTGLYEPSASWNFDLPANYDFRPYSLIVEDIDNDGADELIVGVRAAGSGSSREIRVVSVQGEYDGFVIWETEWSYAQTFGGSLYSVTTGDLDNDGNREIYAFIWNFFTMKIFECTGNKQYTEVFSVDQLLAADGIDHGALDAVRVADVNNDGVNEMYIAATEPANEIFILTGITDVSQIDSTKIKRLYTIPRTAGGKFRSMYIADPDRDGNADLMIGGESNGQIFTLEYKGTGNPADSSSWEHRVLYDAFVESGLTTISPRLFYGSPADDMDKDGNDEYVFVNYSPDYGTWPDDVPLRVIEIDRATGVIRHDGIVPGKTELLPNYPNPFNPTTTIRYRTAAAGPVKVIVYDLLGKETAVLVDEVQNAGEYTVRFNAAGLASGLYIYSLQAGTTTEMKKMMLLK
jgi:hypothetical protein